LISPQLAFTRKGRTKQKGRKCKARVEHRRSQVQNQKVRWGARMKGSLEENRTLKEREGLSEGSING